MAVTLCVLLWPCEGRDAELIAYEDYVLSLLPNHGARVLQRARSVDRAGTPLEVHLVWFASEEALDGYMNDPRRTARLRERDAAIERTEVMRVELIGSRRTDRSR